jgi:SAM-dependent methyltransferase
VRTEFTAFHARPLRPRPDRVARLFDDEVHPLLGARLGALVLRTASLRPRSTVLVLDGGAGAFTSALLARLDEASRVVALERGPAFTERARARLAGATGSRVVLRAHATGTPLPFAEETFLSVLAPVSAPEAMSAAALADAARVVAPGGELVLASPIRGTWAELLDLLREALERNDRGEALRALDEHLAAEPDEASIRAALEGADLTLADVELVRWQLVFRTAREFFYAPIVEQGPLPRWKDIAGRGPMLQRVFRDLKASIDTYYGGRPFGVTVLAARVRAVKAGG